MAEFLQGLAKVVIMVIIPACFLVMLLQAIAEHHIEKHSRPYQNTPKKK